MTSKDLMPFGKHKGVPLADVPKSYSIWLCAQDGFAEKNKDLYLYFTAGEAAVAAPKELISNALEDDYLKATSPGFKLWWNAQFGNRLRGSDHYLPHLRCAIAAWEGALHHSAHIAHDIIPDTRTSVKYPPSVMTSHSDTPNLLDFDTNNNPLF